MWKIQCLCWFVAVLPLWPLCLPQNPMQKFSQWLTISQMIILKSQQLLWKKNCKRQLNNSETNNSIYGYSQPVWYLQVYLWMFPHYQLRESDPNSQPVKPQVSNVESVEWQNTPPIKTYKRKVLVKENSVSTNINKTKIIDYKSNIFLMFWPIHFVHAGWPTIRKSSTESAEKWSGNQCI